MSTSTYRYLGPYTLMVVLGHEMTIGSEAELDDDFITKVTASGRWKFEQVPVLESVPFVEVNTSGGTEFGSD